MAKGCLFIPNNGLLLSCTSCSPVHSLYKDGWAVCKLLIKSQFRAQHLKKSTDFGLPLRLAWQTGTIQKLTWDSNPWPKRQRKRSSKSSAVLGHHIGMVNLPANWERGNNALVHQQRRKSEYRRLQSTPYLETANPDLWKRIFFSIGLKKPEVTN